MCDRKCCCVAAKHVSERHYSVFLQVYVQNIHTSIEQKYYACGQRAVTASPNHMRPTGVALEHPSNTPSKSTGRQYCKQKRRMRPVLLQACDVSQRGSNACDTAVSECAISLKGAAEQNLYAAVQATTRQGGHRCPIQCGALTGTAQKLLTKRCTEGVWKCLKPAIKSKGSQEGILPCSSASTVAAYML